MTFWVQSAVIIEVIVDVKTGTKNGILFSFSYIVRVISSTDLNDPSVLLSLLLLRHQCFQMIPVLIYLEFNELNIT